MRYHGSRVIFIVAANAPPCALSWYVGHCDFGSLVGHFFNLSIGRGKMKFAREIMRSHKSLVHQSTREIFTCKVSDWFERVKCLSALQAGTQSIAFGYNHGKGVRMEKSPLPRRLTRLSPPGRTSSFCCLIYGTQCLFFSKAGKCLGIRSVGTWMLNAQSLSTGL